MLNQYELWFDRTPFYKMYEDARCTNWGRQQQTINVQLPFHFRRNHRQLFNPD
jgi:hypothetical protein